MPSKQYDTFIFESYDFDESVGKIYLRYGLDSEVTFVESIDLPEKWDLVMADPAALERALFMLHLIGGMSYYKTCLPKNIEIRTGSLTAEQAAFWNDVYENGLGEFFFKNKIDFRGLINFPATNQDPLPASRFPLPASRFPRFLVPIGGGKDSIVTIELLKKADLPQTLLRVGAHPFIGKMAQIAGVQLLTVGRNLSPALFDMNAAGALNGHVPITAYISILSIVLAEIYGYTHVVFSNENSANEGNTTMHGKEINHQWSKSLAFEKALQIYLEKNVTPNVQYFSLLRPLSELQIVQMFTEYPQYFQQFTSCNTNWRVVKERPKDRWCATCPKCAFAFAMLAAFLPKDTVVKIFEGKDLFANADLVPLFEELLGQTDIKPFECVGTPEETLAALSLADESGVWEGSPVINMFHAVEMKLKMEPEDAVKKSLTPSTDHSIPDEYLRLLPL